MKTPQFLFPFIGLLLFSALSVANNGEDARQMAAEAYFAKAALAWEKLIQTEAPPRGSPRWRELTFQFADAGWRSLAATIQRDQTVFSPHTTALILLTETTEPDRWSAEAHRSLGEFYYKTESHLYESRKTGTQHFRQAFDQWSLQENTPENRKHLLDLIMSLADPHSPSYARVNVSEPPHFSRNLIWTDDQLNLARSLAQTQKEQSILELHLLAREFSPFNFRQVVSEERHNQMRASFARIQETATPEDDWFDFVVITHGFFLENFGRWNGQTSQAENDYTAALNVYRLVSDHEAFEGRMRYFGLIKSRVNTITQPALFLTIPEVIRTDSLIQFTTSARNVDEVTLTIRAIDGDATFSHAPNWVLPQLARTRISDDFGPVFLSEQPDDSWGQAIIPEWPHERVRFTSRRDPLPPGAYWIEATGWNNGEKVTVTGRYALVTDATLLYQDTLDGSLVFVCNMDSGEPLSGTARSFHIERVRVDGKMVERVNAGEKTALTSDGLARLNYINETEMIWAETELGPVLLIHRNHRPSSSSETIQPYIYTERPLYRPGEVVYLRYVERTPTEQGLMPSPERKTVTLVINDSRNQRVELLKLTLDAFGVAEASFTLPDDAALGVYRLTHPNWRGDAQSWNFSTTTPLFRVEEFRTPEFRLSIQPPTENGQPRIVRERETVEVEVQVEYYAGGAIPDAEVDYTVTLRPIFPEFRPPTVHPWFRLPRIFRIDPSSERAVTTGTVRTDDQGIARIRFEAASPRIFYRGRTSRDAEYVIHVTARDASRRTIQGSGTVRVSSLPYRWGLYTAAEVYRPRAEVVLNIHALDAYDRPVDTAGTVSVSQQVWAERVHEDSDTGEKQVIDRRIKWVPVKEESFSTGANGIARFGFTPMQTGLYRFETVSSSRLIRESHTVLVATEHSHALPIEIGNLRLYSERQTYRPGETGRIVVVSPYQQNSTVLLTTHGRDLLDAQVLRMEGNVHVLDIPLTNDAAPNLHLRALMMRDRVVQHAETEWLIPPEDLILDITLDDETPESFSPGQAVELGFTVRNNKGEPVKGSFSFGITDHAIQAIQPRFENDIRAFFYGKERKLFSRVILPQLQHRAYSNIPVRPTEVRGNSDESALGSPSVDYWRDAHTGEKLEDKIPMSSQDIVAQLRSVQIKEALFENKSAAEIIAELSNLPEVSKALPGLTFSPSVSVTADQRFHFIYRDISLYDLIRHLARQINAKETISYAEHARVIHVRLGSWDGFDFRTDYRFRDAGLGVGSSSGPSGATYVATPPAPARVQYPQETFDPARLGEEAIIRSHFLPMAYWSPMIITDSEGRGKVTFTFPENLTEWEILIRGVTRGSEVGQNLTLVTTNVPVAMRVQAPRFLVEGDYALLSGIVQNLTDEDLEGGLDLKADGLQADRTGFEQYNLPVGQQVRIERGFHANAPSDMVTITGEVRTQAGSDAMERTFPVIEYGVFQYHGDSTVLRLTEAGLAEAVLSFNLPPQKHPERASLDLRLSASLASSALDALPYLAAYPYGCTEQTLSRFLPAILIRRTLNELNLDPIMVEDRLFGGIEEATIKEQSRGRKRSLTQLDDMARKEIRRLIDMQRSDGAWGWWKDSPPNAWMTAYAAMGLALVGAKADLPGAVSRSVLDRAQEWLRTQMIHYRNQPDLAAFMLYAIAIDPKANWDDRAAATADYLWENRSILHAYGQSLLILSFHHRQTDYPDYADRARRLIGMLENGIREVREGSELLGEKPGVVWAVHWGEAGTALQWVRNGVESTSWALRALLAVEPDSPRAEQAMRWLVQQRRGAQWSNTRDSALAVMALADYIRVKEEAQSELEVEVLVNGQPRQTFTLAGETALGVQSLNVTGDKLTFGPNTITFRTTGQGTLYASLGVEYFTREDPIPAAGSHVYVTREYRKEQSVVRLDGGKIQNWVKLESGDQVQAGDRVEARILIEVPVDLEFLVFEDKKPAGLEPEQQRSGEPMYTIARQADGNFDGKRTYTHMEIREQHTAFFVYRLSAGVHEIRYTLRAETPGRFTALPLIGHAMYVPEVRANSDSFRLTIAK